MKKMTQYLGMFFVFVLAGPVAVQGNTDSDLGAEWWQWALSAPATDTPLFDDGTNCRVGQQGPVWFLAGTLGNGSATDPTVRKCDVPAGKAIFFPVINAAYFAFVNDPDKQRTAEFVRDTAQNACDDTSIRDIHVTIDDEPVVDPAQHYTHAKTSPIFQIQLPTDNLFGAVASEDELASNCPKPKQGNKMDKGCLVIPERMLSPSAHQGYYFYLEPQEKGNHKIEWKATWDCNFDGNPDFETESTENMLYYLNVLPGVTGEVF